MFRSRLISKQMNFKLFKLNSIKKYLLNNFVTLQTLHNHIVYVNCKQSYNFKTRNQFILNLVYKQKFLELTL